MKSRGENAGQQGEVLVRWEILLFLRRNPGVVDTAEGIALRIYRDPTLIQSELSELCQAGYVRTVSPPGGVELFALDDKRETDEGAKGDYAARPDAGGASQAERGTRSQ